MRTRFITASAQPGSYPEVGGLPEVAFVGRSNVGKSSLLNALVQARIARISRTPGRTQAINFFEVDDGRRRFALADLPGYGFAKVPRAIQANWEPLIEGYLAGRAQLRAVLLLVDLRREPEADDHAVFAWLAETLARRDVRLEVVGTKVDKLPKAQQKPALARTAAALGIERDRLFRTSASSLDGIDALRAHLFELVPD
jgi:GTP-binding protein